MKKILAVASVAVLALASGAAADVVGSKHDLSSTGPGATTNVQRVCVFCHTPHQAATANAQDPLWNHTLSSAGPYTAYSSATLNATISNLPVAPTDGTASVSNLCLSCHDGTVSVASMYNNPNETGAPTLSGSTNVTAAGLIINNPNMGTNLGDDHPVNFTYNTALETADGELHDPTTAAVANLLNGGTVQCSSCHDPHKTTYGTFLALDNTNSALCTTCHIK